MTPTQAAHELRASRIADVEQARALAGRKANGHPATCVCPTCFAEEYTRDFPRRELLRRLRTVPAERLWA